MTIALFRFSGTVILLNSFEVLLVTYQTRKTWNASAYDRASSVMMRECSIKRIDVTDDIYHICSFYLILRWHRKQIFVGKRGGAWKVRADCPWSLSA